VFCALSLLGASLGLSLVDWECVLESLQNVRMTWAWVHVSISLNRYFFWFMIWNHDGKS
jgi:hypothetical protein